MSATETEAPIKVPLETYHLDAGMRVIVGIGHKDAADRVVFDQLLDAPVDQPGRAYVIESGRQPQRELKALLADYLEQAADLGYCPMSRDGLKEKLARGCRQEEALC